MPDKSSKLKLGKGNVFVKSHLKRLRQGDETWEADFRALPKPVMHTANHYIGMVVTQPDGFYLADLQVERPPNVNDLAILLAHAMRRPLVEGSHRPRRILLRKNSRWKELFPHLNEIGIEVVVQDDLPIIANAFEDYLRHLEIAQSAGKVKPTAEQAIVEKVFPAIALWINGGYGHIEIGDQEGSGFIARALDYGGLVFEDETPITMAEAMAVLERKLAQWFRDKGITLE